MAVYSVLFKDFLTPTYFLSSTFFLTQDLIFLDEVNGSYSVLSFYLFYLKIQDY